MDGGDGQYRRAGPAFARARGLVEGNAHVRDRTIRLRMGHTVAYGGVDLARPMADLSERDWARAALVAWGRGGLPAVAVEPLAAELGVTKGSFYWHFSNRAALVLRTVELWERLATDDVIARLETIDDPADRLRALFREAWDRIDFLRAEAAIGASAATGDPVVRPVYERVQSKRLDYVTRLYRELGAPRARARRLAIAAYGAFLGSVQIVLLGAAGLRTDGELRAQVRVFDELLIPRGTDGVGGAG
ncbi:MAG: TetR/AcrR family transcriptional regulator [Myxococcales bacterium FL481]|nr:MAG: TetR/AcrR family transcriptional regulator [Myxococcales bacterium FL481]